MNLRLHPEPTIASGRRLAELLSQGQRRVLRDERGVLMSPAQVTAGLFLGTVLTSDLPDLAARWLAAGLDTPALRELAGHAPGDAWGVEHLWTRVAHELGQSAPRGVGGTGDPVDEDEAWLRVLPVELARWRLGETSAALASECLLRAGRDSAPVNALVGLEDLFWLEEYRFEPAADPTRLDRERDVILTTLAEDVIL